MLSLVRALCLAENGGDVFDDVRRACELLGVDLPGHEGLFAACEALGAVSLYDPDEWVRR